MNLHLGNLTSRPLPSLHEAHRHTSFVCLRSFGTAVTAAASLPSKQTVIKFRENRNATKIGRNQQMYPAPYRKGTSTVDLDTVLTALRQRDDSISSHSLTSDDIRHLIATSFARNQPQLALELISHLPPNGRNYTMLTKQCMQKRDARTLDAALAAWDSSGLPPNSFSASAHISRLSMTGRHSEVLSLAQDLWQNPSCRSVQVVNAALASASITGDWAGAERALELLQQEGIPPDIVTYNTLIKTAGAAQQMDKVVQLYEQLLEEGLVPTAVTYTSVFNAAGKNRYADAAWLLKVSFCSCCCSAFCTQYKEFSCQ